MENTNSNVWLAAALILVVLVAGLWIANGNNITEDEVKDIVVAEMNKLKIPTATEIASEIVIEVPEWEVPVIPEFESDDKVDDLWKDLYKDVIADLKSNAEIAATTELDKVIAKCLDRDKGLLFDFLVTNIENLDEIEGVEYIEDEEEEIEVTVTVVELGLEDEEDKVAQVVFELEVKYSLSVGPSTVEYE